MNKERLIAFKVDIEERDEIQRMADSLNVSVSEFCRQRIFTFKGDEIATLQLPTGELIEAGKLKGAKMVFIRTAGNGKGQGKAVKTK